MAGFRAGAALFAVILAAAAFAAGGPIRVIRLPAENPYAALSELPETEAGGIKVRLGWNRAGVYGMTGGDPTAVLGGSVRPGETKGTWFLPYQALGREEEPSPNEVLDLPCGAAKFIFTELNRTMPRLKLECERPEGWSLELTTECAEGAMTGTCRVRGRRTAPARPPKFKVRWEMPQAGLPFLWTDRGFGGIPADWASGTTSGLLFGLPLDAIVAADGMNCLTWGAREPRQKVRHGAGVHEETAEVCGFFSFHESDEPAVDGFEKVIRFDWRKVPYYEAVSGMSAWMREDPACAPIAPVPEGAFDPLYSTWYGFHQRVNAAEIEEECRIAGSLGMKTLIVDDGWQTDDNNRGYMFCGDWEVATNKIADMRAHVAAVHAAGLRYLPWIGVPLIGRHSKNYAKLARLSYESPWPGHRDKVRLLDPRFPEAREFMASLCERMVRDCDVDGFKLDFVDCLGGGPAAVAGDGRDIASESEATERMLAEVESRVRRLKPEALFEFRQMYVGPAIGRFANMFRVEDCPGNPEVNRRGIAHLRLTSGETAVHGDMLEWNVKEPAEYAARHVLNSIFGVVQYSMRLKGLPEKHRRMIAHWLRFSLEHRETLLKGRFMPLYPELGYAVIGGESAAERIWGVYNRAVPCAVGAPDRKVIVMNGSGLDGITLELPVAPAGATVRDCFGELQFRPELKLGSQFVTVPSGGYIDLEWKAPVARYNDYDGTLIDNCWMWGHDSGVYDGPEMTYGIPVSDPVTMAEGIRYMGIPNVCVVRWGDAPAKFRPQPPRRDYLRQFAGVKRFTWAIANNRDSLYAQTRRFVPAILDEMPNMIGFDLDDFFRAHLEPTVMNADEGEVLVQPGALSPAELKELAAIARAYGRPLDLRMTVYVKDLKPEIAPLMKLADSVALWTWSGGEITELERNFAKYRELVPDVPTLLGIYMWDFGGKKPLEVPQMEYQLSKALEFFKAGRIDGLVFHCTPLVNKKLAAVEYCREWLAEHGRCRR